jgi:Domain of unknown function (DUF5122) beta-propeller
VLTAHQVISQQAFDARRGRANSSFISSERRLAMRATAQRRPTAWDRSGIGKRAGKRTAAILRQAVWRPESLESRTLLSFNAHLTAPPTGSLNAAYIIDLWTTGGTASKWVVNWGDTQTTTYTSTPFANPQAETHTYTSAPTGAVTATATLSTNSGITSKAVYGLSSHFGTGEDFTGSGETVYAPPSSSPTGGANAAGVVMVKGGGACGGSNFLYVASSYNGNQIAITRFTSPTSTTLGGVVDLAWGANLPGVSQGTLVIPAFGTSGTEVDTPTAMCFDNTDGDLIVAGQVKITSGGTTTYHWGFAKINEGANGNGSQVGNVELNTFDGLPSGSSSLLKPNAIVENELAFDEVDFMVGTDGTHMVAVSLADNGYAGTPNWTSTIAGATSANTVIESRYDNNLVLGGFANWSSCCGTSIPSDFTLVRLAESDGSLDNTFGFHGIVRTNFGCLLSSGCCTSCCSPSVDSDYSVLEWQDTNTGNWYLIGVGSTTANGSDQFALARYNESNGSRNNSFGPNGNGLSVPGLYGDAYSAALQGSGNGNTDVHTDPAAKIVAAGGNGSDFVIARFTNSASGGGNLDTTFGNFGVVQIDFGSSTASSTDTARSIILPTDPSGDDTATDFLVAGSTNTNSGSMAIVDYSPQNHPTIS